MAGLKKASTRVDKTDRFTPQTSTISQLHIPLTPPFKGFVRFIRYVALHSLRFTSFVSLCFIRFALLCFTSLASLIPFASLRSTHSASLHSFRFTPLIPFHSTHFTYSTLSGVIRFIYEVSSLFPFDSFH